MSDPLVITAAITGSITAPDQTPHVPLTPKAIVAAALESWRAGASIIHVHARYEDGAPTQDPEIFRQIVAGIEEAGCDAVLNLSTGSAGGRAELDERGEVLELRPEMATLDCGSINFGDERIFENPYWWLRKTATRMKELSILPEIECFDGGMIENGRRLIGEGLIKGPGVWQLCLGVRGGAPADVDTVAHMLGRLPEGAFWTLLAVGRHQLPMNMIAIAAGGHVRTGLEDNVYYRRGELATGNAQLVERIVRLADEAGRPVATPAEARELVGLGA